MTTIGMHYDVIPGKEEEFERGFLSVIEVLKTLPGHVESHLYEDVASVGSYALLGAEDATVVLNTLPIMVDSTPTFDTKLR